VLAIRRSKPSRRSERPDRRAEHAATRGNAGTAKRPRPGLSQARRVSATQAALLAALVIGAVTGPLALTGVLSRPATAAPRTRPAQAVTPVGVTGFAELYVTAYVNRADKEHPDALAQFYPAAAADPGLDLDSVEAGPFYTSRTAPLAVTATGPDYWTVTVAAEVLQVVDGAYQPAGTRFYTVAVHESAGRYVATSLPGLVPAPPTAAPPKLAGGQLRPPLEGDQVAAALQRFFEAFLAGQGELGRYVGQESGVMPVTPAPFTKVTLTRLSAPPATDPAAGQRRTVRAEVSGVDAAEHTTVLQYALDLELDSGRWEVRRLRGAPPLAAPQTG